MEPAESSSSSKFPSPPQEHHNIDNIIQDEELPPAFDVEDLICTEQFDQIMENELQEVVISDASSTNSTMDERKGLSFGDEAVSSAAKVHRVKCISCDEAEGEVVQDMKMNDREEKEQGHNESKDDYGNQESEKRETGDQESDPNDGEEDRNQEDSNEEEEDEDKKEDKDDDEGENRNQENNEEEEEDEEIEDETEEETEEEAEEGEKEESQPVVEGKQQEPDNEKGRATRKRLFSELYESQTRTEVEGQEDMADDTEGEKHNDQQEHTENNAERENHENSQNSDEQADNGDEVQEEEEVEDEEEEKRKAIAKGKRPQICKLAFVVRKYSNLQRGETSYIAEEEAIDNRQKEEVNQDSHEDEQDLVILKAISHFYYSNGYAPSPSSIELHKHIKNSIPSLTIRGEELTTKIGTLEDQFRTVKDLDGDNPDLPRPIDREIFDLSMSIWGHSEDDLVHNQGVPALNIDYQEHFLRHFLRNYLS